MRKIIGLFTIAMTLIGSFFTASPVALANQSTFCMGDSTGATTTPAYMTPGTATSTLTNNICASDRTVALDRLFLAMQFTASSTATNLTGAIEGSIDGVDWYPIPFGTVASTSPSLTIQSTGAFNWQFASSTPGGGTLASTTNRIMKIIEVPTWVRYTRVWTGVTGGNGAFWGQFIGVRQQLAR